MRIAALYDIHGNLPALEAVVLEIRRVGVDLIVVGGDILPGPMPRETMACLESLDVPVQLIHGNGDREVLAAISGTETLTLPAQALEAIRWTARQLRPGDERVLAGWPATVRLDVDGVGAVLFCHATPRNDTDIFTRLTPEDRLLPIFEAVDTPVVVCGHTHMQFDRFVGRTRVVNAGSVGMPFQEPGAYWLLLGPGVEFRYTRYDLRDAAERIRATSYPQAEAFAARNVLQTPSEGEMLKVFTETALRP